MSDFDVAYISGQPLTTVISTNWAWIKLGYLYPKMWYNIDYYPPLGPRCWNMRGPMLSKRSNRGRGLSPSKYSRHSVPFMHAMTLGTSGAALVWLLWGGNLAIWRWQLSTKSWRIQDKLWPMFKWCGHSTTFLQFKHADPGNSEPQVNTPMGWWCSNWH